MLPSQRVAGSFRDPSGFVFEHEGVLYRHVAEAYRLDFDELQNSGLYRALADDGMIVPHDEVPPAGMIGHEAAYRVLRPRRVPFISYPYEWSFSQLKDAALLTLEIQRRALARGMWLKDASAYNIQFIDCSPIFIDTLSFERYPEGSPWTAYQQFCRQFLAPLALMAWVSIDLGKLMRLYIDGVPLGLASRLLPHRTWLRFSLLVHVHLHALSIRRHQQSSEVPALDAVPRSSTRGLSKTSLLGLVGSLDSAVRGLTWEARGTEWADYYGSTNYGDDSRAHKAELVDRFIEEVAPCNAWDLGANTGELSRLAARRGIPTVAFDMDPAAVDKTYRATRSSGESHLLPLLMDLTNPSAGIGWSHEERTSLRDRGPVDLVLALALVHHLAIGNNVPLPMIARFLHDVCNALVIEFVPKGDSQVKRLLASRADLFPEYSAEGFEAAFSQFFTLRRREAIKGSQRVLYLFDRRASQ